MGRLEPLSKSRMQYRGLRGWLDAVDKLGELRQVEGAHWDVEMGAITHMLTEKSRGSAPAPVPVSSRLPRPNGPSRSRAHPFDTGRPRRRPAVTVQGPVDEGRNETG